MKAWTLFSPSGRLGRPWSYCQLWYPFPLLLSCLSSAPPFFACMSYMSYFSFCSSGGEDHSELGRAVLSSSRFSTEPHGCFSLCLSLCPCCRRALECCEDSLPRHTPLRIISIPRKLVSKRYQFILSLCPSVVALEFSYCSQNLFPAPSRQESLGCRGDCRCCCLIWFGLFFVLNELRYRSTLHFKMRSDFWVKKCIS